VTDPAVNGSAAVRVVHATDPVAEGGRLAAELDADVALDAASAADAVRRRAEASEQAVSDDPGADADVLARAEAIRAAATAAADLTEATVTELRELAADIVRAERIRHATEERVATRVAVSSSVTLHPASLVAASRAVVEAEAALAAAERALLEHAAPPDADDDGPSPAATATEHHLLAPHDDFDEARLDRRRLQTNVAAVLVVVLAAAVVALVLGAPLAAVALGTAVAAVVGVTAVVRLTPRTEGEADARAHLAAVAAAVAATESGRKAAALASAEASDAPAGEPATKPADDEARRRAEAARDEATELLRVARNRWHQLAGPDADPHDPEAVARAHDPQFEIGPRVLEASPTVRAAGALLRRLRARWRVAWAALGRDEPPPPEALDEALAEVRDAGRRAADDLARLEAAEARVRASAEARRPLVLVDPRRFGPPGQLAELLAAVPPEGEVVLVEERQAVS
jgi:hypothetical protein